METSLKLDKTVSSSTLRRFLDEDERKIRNPSHLDELLRAYGHVLATDREHAAKPGIVAIIESHDLFEARERHRREFEAAAIGVHSQNDVAAGLGKYAAERTQRNLPSFVEAIGVVSAGLGITHVDLDRLVESVFRDEGFKNGDETPRRYLAYRFLRERREISTEFFILRPPVPDFPSMRFATWFLDDLHNVCEENGVVLASGSQMFCVGQVVKKSCLTFSAFSFPLARRTLGTSLTLRVSASPSSGRVVLQETRTIEHSDQAGLARIDYRKFCASSDLPEPFLRELGA